MNVVHLAAGELNSGAARGAYWLHKALRKLGVDSTFLCNARVTPDDPSVVSIGQSLPDRMKFSIAKRAGNAPVRLYARRQQRMFNTGFGGLNIARQTAVTGADLVHLHFINGLVRFKDLRRIGHPLIWTVRDMWPFTGGCHYALDCDRYTGSCGACPQLSSKRKADLSHFVIRHKQKHRPENLQIVGISQWISDCARHSTVFRDMPVQTISNNIDTSLFFPSPKAAARKLLGITGDERIVLIGAQHVTDFYKGFDVFRQAIECLEIDNVHVVIFGNSSDRIADSVSVRTTNLGFIHDDEWLRLAYNAADLFVAPSMMDAFGKTLAEAMSCGTPVVCFDATGPRDIVEHKVSGYQATPFCPEDLARGIRWILARSPEEYGHLSRQSRERAQRLFDSRITAQQYLRLYEDTLSGSAD
jgi:glycosyltransferase involved in cell wall biosynthesis